jgi:prevent-host-death family protein
MARKSDKEPESRVSATEASRNFSRLLDEVEAGRRFVIRRRGRDVCAIVPPAPAGRRISECLAVLRARPPVTLDDGFGVDLRSVLAGERTGEPPSWDS